MQKPMCDRYSDVLLYVDESRPVEVYRNLHKKCLSVRQGGIVRCHAHSGVFLRDAKFVVGVKGRDRVRNEKKKNVHAFIRGYACSPRTADKEPEDLKGYGIYYNPYTCDFFRDTIAAKYVAGAKYVDIAGQSDDLVPQILAFGIEYK